MNIDSGKYKYIKKHTLPLRSSPSAEVAAHSGVRAPWETGCNTNFFTFYEK